MAKYIGKVPSATESQARQYGQSSPTTTSVPLRPGSRATPYLPGKESRPCNRLLLPRRSYRSQPYLIIASGIVRMIAGTAIRIATLMRSTKTNHPQPLNMSVIDIVGATPRST